MFGMKKVYLDRCKYLTLDEADSVLDLGYEQRLWTFSKVRDNQSYSSQLCQLGCVGEACSN
ncbi:hypothetical protein KC19_11G160700 [Ceratodon purpureus]|uniref:Uncharacterized protein n=1 Tax=Ceratodon purpureus TaxID=3225 RepID=A0A8T0GGV2_CERPU|nr:hypothetical protein KC19_N030300 [Ceratodon purpureus]KAG0557835.1 hypothetical protein KC19_11G160700 [Ceratodon purpureus]